jgi:hypothetical protein
MLASMRWGRLLRRWSHAIPEWMQYPIAAPSTGLRLAGCRGLRPLRLSLTQNTTIRPLQLRQPEKTEWQKS